MRGRYALAIILCAALMAMGAGEIVQQCALKLASGSTGQSGPRLTVPAVGVLVGVVVVKLALFVVCYRWRHVSGSIRALAFDHIADTVSNCVALLAAVLAGWDRTRAWLGPGVWMADPIGGMVIALGVIAGWGAITWEHVTKLMGRHASEELVRRVEEITDAHHPQLKRDALRCYHAGEGVLVELEVVMPSAMTVRASHDICLGLQDAVEALDEVERAFVHVDYVSRCYPEHKTERQLLQTQASVNDVDGRGLSLAYTRPLV